MGDYFGFNRQRGNTDARDRLNVPQTPGTPSRPMRPASSRDSMRNPSSIRIRRLPSYQTAAQANPPQTRDEAEGIDVNDTAVTGRRRSSSAPQSMRAQYLNPPGQEPSADELNRIHSAQPAHMGTITEGKQLPPTSPGYHPGYQPAEDPGRPYTPSISAQTPGLSGMPPTSRVVSAEPGMTDAANAARRNRGLRRFKTGTGSVHPRHQAGHDEYQSDVVDLLDLVDPEVRTIGTLTNLQNSLFVPDLGGFLNRRPTYELTTRRSDLEGGGRRRAGTRASQRPATERMATMPEASPAIEMRERPRGKRTGSLSSQLSESRYAVLPHGVDLQGWTQDDVDDLNDHVRHLLHSRREGFKRSMRGFRQYLSKPLGLFVFVYATLVTLFGAAWVFCLIGWIYVGNEQSYFINVIDLVLVALFALIGDGLAPFRAVDTYHMCFIAHYHHLTWRLRQKKKLPDLVDHNDLPDRRVDAEEVDDIVDKEETAEFSVLSPRQQRRLQYHQAKFSKAHTFYKPHETTTHHAFPLRLLVAVVVLLDCHTLFQVALGTCTWSIDYHVRPQALTATILSCSITCNIVAGIVISIGDHRTRKKDVLERMFRQGLTEEAIQRVQKKKTLHEDMGAQLDEPIEGTSSGSDSRGKESAYAAENGEPAERRQNGNRMGEEKID